MRHRCWSVALHLAVASVALVFVACGAGAQTDSAPSPLQSAAASDDPYEAATVDPTRTFFSPKILHGTKHPPEEPARSGPDERTGLLQSGQSRDWPRIFRDDRWQFNGSVSATLALYKMWANLFGPPAAHAPEGFRTDPGWGEYFVQPGFTMSYQWTPATSFYGGAAYLESGTRNVDYGGYGYTNHGDMEELYAGMRWREAAAGTAVDISYGQQEFMVGNGMLLAAGATNGGQRGAYYLAPRYAWAQAGLVKITRGDTTATAFYLRPNEASAQATGTRLAGFNIDWNPAGPLRLGGMYLRLPESDILTRSGLDVYDVRARWHPLNASPNLWVQGEYVWQRKAQVAGTGWYVQGNYNALDSVWKPLVAIRYASLSGDRQSTTKWEGFDPLYFGNGYPNWYQGRIGSAFLGNTNVDTASITVTLTPSEKQIVEFGFLNFAANQANSPLAIPAVNTVPTPGGGVPRKPLASELDATYTYTFSKRINLGALVAYAAPGSGFKDLYATSGGGATGWWFIGTQFNVSY